MYTSENGYKIRKEKEIEKINYFDRDRKIMSTIVKSDNEYISYIIKHICCYFTLEGKCKIYLNQLLL